MPSKSTLLQPQQKWVFRGVAHTHGHKWLAVTGFHRHRSHEDNDEKAQEEALIITEVSGSIPSTLYGG